jgi:CRP-like cAMP-binding protein
VTELLRGVPLLAALVDEEVAELAARAELIDVPPGTVLTAAGTDADRLYLVVEGQAVVTLGGAPIARVGRGEMVGTLGVVASVPRATSVVAETSMAVAGLQAAHVWELLDDPATAARLAARPPAP